MRSFFLVLLIFTCNTQAFSNPGDDFSDAVIKGKAMIKTGVQKFDGKILLEARSHFERLSQNKQMQWLTHYYIGLADYRLAIFYQSQNKRDQLIKYLDDAIENMHASLKKNEEFADAHGLLSALLGQKIGTDHSLGMTLGMESMTAMSDAVEYGKSNPRVAMFSAISAYYTPEQYGGSKTRAMQEMNRAVGLFKKENLEDKRLPDWGHDEALTWLAKFNMDTENYDKAKQHLDAALKLDPESQFAKITLEQLQQLTADK